MIGRVFTVDCIKGKLTASGQHWELWHGGVLLYRGLWPINDGARAMVDKHGYQLDDVVGLRWPNGSITPPADLNSRYWVQVRETDARGLYKFPWRGLTQDEVSRLKGVGKDAIDGQNRSGMPDGTESTLGASLGREIESALDEPFGVKP